MIKLIIFLTTVWTSPGGNHYEPAVIPPDLGLAIYSASLHHGQDPLEVASVIAAENEGRKYNEREVGRFSCRGESCEAGISQLKRVWQRLANKRCYRRLREKHRHYKGLGDCLYIKPDQLVLRKLKSRGPDLVVYRLRGGEKRRELVNDPHALRAKIRKGGHLYRHLVGELRGNPRNVDLFMKRVNVEALVIAIQEMSRWQPKYAPELECRKPDQSRKSDCWQPLFRCATTAYAKDGSWVTKDCLRSVNRLLRWEHSLRERHRLLSEWAEKMTEPWLLWERVTRLEETASRLP